MIKNNEYVLNGVSYKRASGCHICSLTNDSLFKVKNYITLFLAIAGGIFTRRLQGYSIRVSNSSKAPAETCYTDPGNVNLPIILENECVATSQYVWFYQTHTASGENSPILEICEVQIFGKHIALLQAVLCISII